MDDVVDLPNGPDIPDGTIAFPVGGGEFIMVRPCDVCFAALIDTHDADYAEHMEWHDRTGTNSPPTAH